MQWRNTSICMDMIYNFDNIPVTLSWLLYIWCEVLKTQQKKEGTLYGQRKRAHYGNLYGKGTS